MNEAQEIHIKGMARHIRERAQQIVSRMEALENNDLIPQPILMAEHNFGCVAADCSAIREVLTDGLADMPFFRGVQVEERVIYFGV